MLQRNNRAVMLHRTNPALPAGPQQETAMSYQFNDQFAAATRQFADTAAQINRLTLQNAQKAFGLQLATLEENAEATFAFFNEAAVVRDFDGLKALLPKGVQVARENVERAISAGQEVFGNTVQTNEAVAGIAKAQVEAATTKVQAEAEKVVKTAAKTAKRR
jgi:hypothetical protein